MKMVRKILTVNILSGNRLDLERFRDIQDKPGREAFQNLVH